MLRILKLHRNRKRTKAQGMVEFALALPILLLLVLGIIEFARLMLTYSAVYSASREAARYAIAEGDSVNGVPHYEDCDEIRANGVRVGSFGGVQPGDIEIRYDNGLDELTLPFADVTTRCDGDTDPSIAITMGDRVRVQVSTQFDPIVPLVNLPSFDVTSETARTFYTGIDIRGTPQSTSTHIPTVTVTKTPEPTQTKKNDPPPTDTSTPTETPTKTGTLPTPTETPTKTATLTPFVPSGTPTRTDTPTPTASPTGATPTPTLTDLPTIDCPSIIRFGNPIVGGNLFSILISNRSSIGTPEVTTIRSLRIMWPNSDKYLTDGWFGIYPFVTSGPNSTPFYSQDMSSVYFISDTIFQLGFDSVLDPEADLPTIEIAFDDNCYIRFDGSPLPGTEPLPSLPE